VGRKKRRKNLSKEREEEKEVRTIPSIVVSVTIEGARRKREKKRKNTLEPRGNTRRKSAQAILSSPDLVEPVRSEKKKKKKKEREPEVARNRLRL